MKKAVVYRLPTIGDRKGAETALANFLAVQSGKARNIMLMSLKTLLQKYNLSKLPLSKCIIELNIDQEIIIKAKKFTADQVCPGCGEELYTVSSRIRILSICEGKHADIVTYGCCCGEIFGKVETGRFFS